MTQLFTPKINRNSFANAIAKMQENEGKDPKVVQVIQSKLDGFKGLHLHDAFIHICNAYKIDFHDSTIITESANAFKIIIRVNDQDHSSLSYLDRHKDIALDLAHHLYTILAVEMGNEIFVMDAMG